MLWKAKDCAATGPTTGRCGPVVCGVTIISATCLLSEPLRCRNAKAASECTQVHMPLQSDNAMQDTSHNRHSPTHTTSCS